MNTTTENLRPGRRPRLEIVERPWKHPDGDQTPGIALMHGWSVKAHLDFEQARAFADRLHDLCDKADETEEPK